MPELPEVETVRRTLEPRLIGRLVRGVEIRRADVCDGAEAGALLNGAVIGRIERHGKQLAIEARNGRAIRVHLGMTGRLVVRGEAASGSNDAHAHHVHVVWRLDEGVLAFEDPRRFGGIAAYESLAALRDAEWRRLGPDALTISTRELTRALAGGRLAVKAALLDQSRLAGVGNIYADEALFDAGVNPHQRAGSLLAAGVVSRLAGAIRRVLARAVRAGGTTLRDYRDGEGHTGGGLPLCRVYGRGGLPCLTCGGALASGPVAQRTTVWCPRCQPAR
jgi:formamidopyrimidine-DNA glycosylase